jgi:hypothetical protein
MKVANEFKTDINSVLEPYIKSFASLAKDLQMNVIMVQSILKGSDVLLMRRELNTYLNEISWPLYCLFTFIEVNKFVLLLKGVLRHEKYQPLNVMQAIINEKDEIICQLRQIGLQQRPSEESTTVEMLMEIKLVKSENQFLYKALAELEKKLTTSIYCETKENTEDEKNVTNPYECLQTTPPEQGARAVAPFSYIT